MKKLKLIISCLLLVSLGQAQSLEINEALRTLKGNSYNSYLLILPDMSKKEVLENWKVLQHDFKARTRYDGKDKVWFTNDAKIPKLSHNAVDIYAHIEESGETNMDVSLTVWFDLGGAYVSTKTHPNQSHYVFDLLTDFCTTCFREQAQDALKAEEKLLGKLESQLKKLKRENDHYHKEIKEAKATITKMEKNIEINLQDQKDKAVEIQEQKKVVKTKAEKTKRFN